MVNVSFTLSDEHVARLIEAFCGLHDYDQIAVETGETRPNSRRGLYVNGLCHRFGGGRRLLPTKLRRPA